MFSWPCVRRPWLRSHRKQYQWRQASDTYNRMEDHWSSRPAFHQWICRSSHSTKANTHHQKAVCIWTCSNSECEPVVRCIHWFYDKISENRIEFIVNTYKYIYIYKMRFNIITAKNNKKKKEALFSFSSKLLTNLIMTIISALYCK